MKNQRTRHFAIALAACLASPPAFALEIDPKVTPEIAIGGRIVATFDQTWQNGPGSSDSTKLDIADSSLLFGFSKYLFDSESYGFATFGIKAPEDDTDLEDDIYLHQAFAGIGGPAYEVKLGRSRLPNGLTAFPTIRDDDLVDFVYVGNGQSNAEAEEYQIFGGVGQASWWAMPNLRFSGTLLAQTETNLAAKRQSSSNVNGSSVTLAYEIPEALMVAPGVRFAGLTGYFQNLDALGTAPKDEAFALIGALSLNLNGNPEGEWSLDVQGIYQDGAKVSALAERFERRRAESMGVAASLRFLYRPYLQTRGEAAITVAWKDYRNFSNATAFSIVPTYAYRLGSGIDFFTQYQYTENDSLLEIATGIDSEHKFVLGFVFAFDHIFNESVGERGSILNLEHDAFNFGPISGGH